MKIGQIKKEIRILAIDDTPFKKSKKNKKCLIIGVVFRGATRIDGVLSTYITIDGNDSTEQLISLIKNTRHLGQLRCIMLKGISLAGFNLLDIRELNKKTNLPVIIFMRKKPRMEKINLALKKAIKNKKDRLKKLQIIKNAGKLCSIKIHNQKIYFQIAGISKQKAKEIIKLTTPYSLVPEPLRVAHLIAQGILLGESKGRA